MIRSFVFGLLTVGFLLQLDYSKLSLKTILQKLFSRLPKKKARYPTLKQELDKLRGKKKANYFVKTKNEAVLALTQTGQSDKLTQVFRLSVLLGASGVIFSFAVGNFLLAPVLGLGFYFIPLWCTRFSVHRYNKYINDELAVTLSMVTNSYMRSNDLLSAVEENLSNMNGDVKKAFTAFVNNVTRVSPNIEAAISEMKNSIDNKLFWSWCDLITMCQEDYTIKGTLPCAISKFSTYKALMLENETGMMLPLQEATTMILIVIGSVPLLYMINIDWFNYLVHTALGQISLTVTAIVSLVTVNKAIGLSGNIEVNI
ncbi:MAG: hypothetical protein RR009_08635 [Oscillospiraceae bacterium]